MRLIVELSILVGGAFAWAACGRTLLAVLLAVALVVHHCAALPRLRWLANQRRALPAASRVSKARAS